MQIPPMVIDVRVDDPNSKSFRVWLPIVLLWPLLLIVVGFALIVSVLVDLVLWLSGSTYHHFTQLIFGALALLSETRGTHVDVLAKDATVVRVDIY